MDLDLFLFCFVCFFYFFTRTLSFLVIYESFHLMFILIQHTEDNIHTLITIVNENNRPQTKTENCLRNYFVPSCCFCDNLLNSIRALFALSQNGKYFSIHSPCITAINFETSLNSGLCFDLSYLFLQMEFYVNF